MGAERIPIEAGLFTIPEAPRLLALALCHDAFAHEELEYRGEAGARHVEGAGPAAG